MMPSNPTPRGLSDDLRQTFADIADVLIPAYKAMPKASDVGVSGPLLDRALAARPDLLDALLRGLKAVGGTPGPAATETLHRTDRDAFDAIATAASGGYYMDPHVRDLIGYPGQENVVDPAPYATPAYVDSGALQRVFSRGPIYVPTPGVAPKAHSKLLGSEDRA